MLDYVKNGIGRNLANPGRGPFGYIVKNMFLKRNRILEKKAVHFSNIEPDHVVLEVGFGLGLGLKAAYEKVKDGTGTVMGIEISQPMMFESQKILKREIAADKVQLILGNLENMPYEDNQFDRIFHCNCYYFWPDINRAVSELHRVMKPNSMMITTMSMNSLQQSKRRGFMEYANIDPENYMAALAKAGFRDIFLEEEQEGSFVYQVIYGHVGTKD